MKGIIFKPESVAAILSGDKTQTRRLVKHQPSEPDGWAWNLAEGKAASIMLTAGPEEGRVQWPRYRVGEMVYLKEGWRIADRLPGYRFALVRYRNSRANVYAVPDRDWDRPISQVAQAWRSPLHMPAWASRLRLTITGVRVERVRKISEAGACAEGCESVAAYARLWDQINPTPGARWADNPLVWVYEFERAET